VESRVSDAASRAPWISVADDLQPLAAVVDHALGGAKLPLILSALFSIAAMALGTIGVAGILSFDVAERRAGANRIRAGPMSQGLRSDAAGARSICASAGPELG
jgi:hypothetical protein